MTVILGAVVVAGVAVALVTLRRMHRATADALADVASRVNGAEPQLHELDRAVSDLRLWLEDRASAPDLIPARSAASRSERVGGASEGGAASRSVDVAESPSTSFELTATVRKILKSWGLEPAAVPAAIYGKSRSVVFAACAGEAEYWDLVALHDRIYQLDCVLVIDNHHSVVDSVWDSADDSASSKWGDNQIGRRLYSDWGKCSHHEHLRLRARKVPTKHLHTFIDPSVTANLGKLYGRTQPSLGALDLK